jgi:hypothetical protein
MPDFKLDVKCVKIELVADAEPQDVEWEVRLKKTRLPLLDVL